MAQNGEGQSLHVVGNREVSSGQVRLRTGSEVQRDTRSRTRTERERGRRPRRAHDLGDVAPDTLVDVDAIHRCAMSRDGFLRERCGDAERLPVVTAEALGVAVEDRLLGALVRVVHDDLS